MRTAVRAFWRRGLDAGGRATPGEFWLAVLANAATGVVLLVAATIVFTGTLGLFLGAAHGFSATGWALAASNAERIAVVAVLLWGLATLVPSATLLVRRLHDAGLSGLLALLWFLPVLGVLVVLALALLPSADESP